MALSLNLIGCSSHLHPSHSSDRSKVSVGLKLQSPNSFGFAKPNLNDEFYKKLHRNYQPRTDSKQVSGRIVMMAYEYPMVYVQPPGWETGRWMYVWNALYGNRVIFIGETIDEYYSNNLVATLLFLDSQAPIKMNFYINCLGGDISPTMAVYDTMQALQSKVSTTAISFAFDLSLLLLASGEKGQRSAMRKTIMMNHPIVGLAGGQDDGLETDLKEHQRINDYLFTKFAEKTGQPFEKIREDLKYDIKYFTSQEALEYGIIDTILRPPPLTDSVSGKKGGLGLG